MAINRETTAEKQLRLIRQASLLMSDGIYIHAIVLLEEAASYSGEHTFEAEEKLKTAYLALMGNRGISRRYVVLLENQMGRANAQAEIFVEAANYYLSIPRITEALRVLREGIERTGCAELTIIYESNRYAYETIRTSFDYIAAISEATMQVRRDGLWGIASVTGNMIIPCEHKHISTFNNGRAIAGNGSEIFAIDRNNNRIALFRGYATAFGNLSENRIALMIDGTWRRATGELELGTIEFKQIGTYSGGFAAAQTGTGWGVVDLGINWLVDPIYDGVVKDELGRSYAQGAVFMKSGNSVHLFVGGQYTGHTFEDARPFSAEGYAAVRQNGLWGFIDTDGNVVIDFKFDDALSFGQHLAAVEIDGLWGYISIIGQVVIAPEYLEAKSFSNGSAPVRTQRGWQIIRLLEYR